MKKYVLRSLVICLLAVYSSCTKDDYKNDGGVSKAEVNMTTYDYLKSNPQFSELVKLIDKAGLKDVYNGNVTLFAVNNYGVDDWVSAKKEKKVVELNDENITYTIDSVPVSQYKDSLLMYLFKGKITRDSMNTTGKLYTSLLGTIPNVSFEMKLRRDYSTYSGYLDYVDYVTFIKVRGSRDDEIADQSTIPEDSTDMSVDVQTSGIITTNGVIHVLSSSHRLFFNTEPLADN
ncbi:hypothetical protein A9P82_07165 [Arachidicoccus ginsenosidimutans]|uniref:hypothetical protein n=1 Tax=Arachidicoccus sp. BS20 TaxID=1850526 RepID=UPI0007F09D19|nr:hypothetical protein [Arachidicoccus sp. BS20]ANI89088.1 hypothetical protein A9P82_07165 [Arachidicoccus sp. BS20]